MIISGNTSEEDIAMYYDAGADLVITKSKTDAMATSVSNPSNLQQRLIFYATVLCVS